MPASPTSTKSGASPVADRLSIPLDAAWRADASHCSLEPPSPHKPLSCLARNLFDRALPGAPKAQWVRWGLETLAICTEPRRAFGPITGASMARADGITCVILNDVCAVTATLGVDQAQGRLLPSPVSSTMSWVEMARQLARNR